MSNASDAYAPKEIISAASYKKIRDLILQIYDIGYGDRGYGQGPILSENEHTHNANLAVVHPFLNWPHIPLDKNPGDIMTSLEWQQIQHAIGICLLHQNSNQTKLPSEHDFLSGRTVVSEVSFDKIATGDFPFCLKEIDTNRFNAWQSSMTLFGPSFTSTRSEPWTNKIKLTLKVEFDTGDDARYFFNSGGEIRFLLNRYGDTNIPQDAFWTAFLARIGMISFGAHQTKTLNQKNTCSKIYNMGYYDLMANSQKIFTVSGECVKLLPWPQINHHEGDSITEYDLTATPLMDSQVEMQPALQFTETAGTVQLDGTSCNKFAPTKCGMVIGHGGKGHHGGGTPGGGVFYPGRRPGTSMPLTKIKPVNASTLIKFKPAPFSAPPDPGPRPTPAPKGKSSCHDPAIDVAKAGGSAEEVGAARAAFDAGGGCGGNQPDFAFIVALFNWQLKKDALEQTFKAQYDKTNWNLHHQWSLTPESIEDSFPGNPIRGIQQNYFNDSEYLEQMENEETKEYKISYLTKTIEYPVVKTIKNQYIAPRINIDPLFSRKFQSKNNNKISNVSIVYDECLIFDFNHKRKNENFQINDDNSLIISNDKSYIMSCRNQTIKKYHTENDKLTKELTDYVDLTNVQINEYFIRSQNHYIPNPNLYTITTTMIDDHNNEMIKDLFNHGDENNYAADENNEPNINCCNETKPIIGSNVIKTYDGEIKILVTMPACSNEKGELPISIDFIKTVSEKNNKTFTPHFYIPILLPKGISLSMISLIGDAVINFIDLLRKNY